MLSKIKDKEPTFYGKLKNYLLNFGPQHPAAHGVYVW